jgi:hypothetical protein
MYAAEKTTNEKLEEEFERITSLYNQQQTEVHQKRQENLQQSAMDVIQTAEEAGEIVLPASVAVAVHEAGILLFYFCPYPCLCALTLPLIVSCLSLSLSASCLTPRRIISGH